MSHPLAIKYGTGDPATWDAERRAKARDELHEVLGAGKTGKKKLTGADRIELMRIWLAVIAAEHDGSGRAKATDASKAQNGTKTAKARLRLSMPTVPGLAFLLSVLRSMKLADYAFILFLCAITGSVLALGIHSVREVLRIEDVKKEAEDLVQWFKTTAENRKTADFAPSSCNKASTAVWKDCLAALTAEGGPLHGKTNAFEPGRSVMSRKCDQQDIDTIGTIIVEKGAIPLGSSSYSYTPFDGTEPMNKDMILRVLVCGRGFHLIKVQNELAW